MIIILFQARLEKISHKPGLGGALKRLHPQGKISIMLIVLKYYQYFLFLS
jgi:hypothetical protein